MGKSGYEVAGRGSSAFKIKNLETIEQLENLLRENTSANIGGFMSTTTSKKLATDFAKGGVSGQRFAGAGGVSQFELRHVLTRAKVERYVKKLMVSKGLSRPVAEKQAIQNIFKIGGHGAAGIADMFYKGSGGGAKIKSATEGL